MNFAKLELAILYVFKTDTIHANIINYHIFNSKKIVMFKYYNL